MKNELKINKQTKIYNINENYSVELKTERRKEEAHFKDSILFQLKINLWNLLDLQLRLENGVNNMAIPVLEKQKARRKTPLEVHFIYLGNKRIYGIFKTFCIILFHFSQKVVYFIFLFK